MTAQALPLPKLGVDLLSDETDLIEGTVRRAENVDIGGKGTFKRRAGYTVAVAGADFHSLFTYGRGTLTGRGTKVYFIDVATFAPTLLYDMGVAAPVKFAEINDHLYFTNRGALAWLPVDAMTARAVGVALPAQLPEIAASGVGTLTAGTYAVGLSRIDDRGEESPTALLGTVTLAGSGGVQLSNLTIDVTSSYRVYLSPPDGDVLYVAAEFTAAFASYLVGTQPEGAQRSTQHLVPLPPGDFLFGHGGRIYTAVGDVLSFSQAMRPHLTDPRHDFVQFAGAITFAEPVADGIFVGDARGVWFLPGMDPSQFKLRQVSNRPAVMRSALKTSGGDFPKDLVGTFDDVVVWLSTDGYMVGKPGGDVVELHSDRVRIAPGLEGKSAEVTRNGLTQIVTLVAASTAQTAGLALDSSL